MHRCARHRRRKAGKALKCEKRCSKATNVGAKKTYAALGGSCTKQALCGTTCDKRLAIQARPGLFGAAPTWSSGAHAASDDGRAGNAVRLQPPAAVHKSIGSKTCLQRAEDESHIVITPGLCRRYSVATSRSITSPPLRSSRSALAA